MNRLIVPILLVVLGCVIWLVKPLEVQTVEMVAVEHETAPVVKIEPVAPLFNVSLSEDLQELVFQESIERGIDPYLAVAVMLQENYYFEPGLISGTNDYGLFQVNKINHDRMADLGYTDMLDAEDNIKAGIYILAECLASSENYHEALMCYNMGRTGCNRAMAKGIYETKYSRGVLAYYDGLKAGETY